MSIGHFLGGIAALVYHPPTNKYLLLRRSAQKDVGAGNWECPTGRVDQGEGFEEALHREVMEELGVEIKVEFLLGTTHFYRGEEKPENELIGVLYSCIIDDPDAIVISHEHDEYHWLEAAEIKDFLEPNHWLHWTVARAELLRTTLPRATQEKFQRDGHQAGGLNKYR
jgi:8-oxo-dGTP diphosphatase